MHDLISRQATIDAVSDCGICIQRIVDLPSAPRWIPVSKRLPDAEGKYLVTTENRKNGFRRVMMCMFRDGDFLARGNVIAWMHMPAPYMEDHNAFI